MPGPPKLVYILIETTDYASTSRLVCYLTETTEETSTNRQVFISIDATD